MEKWPFSMVYKFIIFLDLDSFFNLKMLYCVQGVQKENVYRVYYRW